MSLITQQRSRQGKQASKRSPTSWSGGAHEMHCSAALAQVPHEAAQLVQAPGDWPLGRNWAARHTVHSLASGAALVMQA